MDVILADYSLPQFDALRALYLLHDSGLDIPFIIVTGSIGEEMAVDCMKKGAADYLLKDRLARLSAAVTQALHERTLREEKRRNQRELARAYEALREADRLKSEMIQNVSHEIRTPLSYLIGYAGLMLDDTMDMGPLTTQQRDNLTIMLHQAERMEHLTGNMVTIQRNAHHQPVRAEVDINVILEDAIKRTRIAADNVKVSLALDTAEGLPSVYIDQMAIDQVLDNLISNALKFTPAGGEVRLRVWQEQSTETGSVSVSVSDTGIGIPVGALPNIFKRFYQVDGSSTRKYDGVGLGLAVCRDIIEAHAESLHVDSTLDEGTTFTFTLPLH